MRNIKAEEKWLKRLQGVGSMLEMVDSGGGHVARPQTQLTEIRLLLPSPSRGDVLVVLKGLEGATKYVAFVGGPDAMTAMLQWKAKEGGSGVKWRVDEWVPEVDTEGVSG